MEFRNHSKNGALPKSLKSRNNYEKMKRNGSTKNFKSAPKIKSIEARLNFILFKRMK